ncbi:t-SNARE [Aureobasidium pullulans]|uniref:t-SNARE n=1 Tax=Aureobasidium pullulans TaxID=5580 RepID=A0A4S9CEC9_AURPU|nr:t-SNARE [Aureobasidium pullulans]THX04610.1 t-SNARE [Aureobasidium pullulans]THY59331.1 t-SNARE [Aureobasidium pullulans]
MWRDRTNLFISYRQSYSHHPTNKKSRIAGGFGDNGESEETRGLMSAGAFDDGDAVIEMDRLPPRWLDVQDQVTEWLDNITKQMKKLDQLLQKHVLPGFDDEQVKRREEREIEAMTQEITRGFQTCQRAIRRIDNMVKESQQTGSLSRGEETMAQNLKVSLATRVGDSSALFRKKQSAYLKKLRALGGMNSPLDRAASPVQNPYTDPSLMDSEIDRSSAQTTLLQTKQKQRSTGLHDSTIAQREREIEDIAQGIIDLSNIFQELQTMVIDQGSMLDRIDYNVENMAVEVKQAEKELKVATGYQKKSTKRKIILLLVLIVAGMFILLMIKPKSRSSPAVTPAPAPVTPTEPEPAIRPPGRLRRNVVWDELISTRKDWRRRKRTTIGLKDL